MKDFTSRKVIRQMSEKRKNLGWIDRLLAVWIILCIIIGLALGTYLPEFSEKLEIGIPIGLFLMICPAMTKIELGEMNEAIKSPKQISIIVFFNYLVNPYWSR